MTRKHNVNPHEKAMAALRVIRTWAKYQLETGHITMLPGEILALCDDAIDAIDANKEARGTVATSSEVTAARVKL